MSFDQYQQMRTQGATARDVYVRAKADGVDEITAIRLLREVFGISLVDAKRATDAADVMNRPQKVAVGGTVYWEGADTVEGAWIMQAKVRDIADGFAYVVDHKKYLITDDGLTEVPHASGPDRIQLRYFEKSLLDRLEESGDFWRQLSELNRA
jgi:hypothetical protein